MGAGHSKWHFVQKLREYGANPNDVVVIIDGDDYFIHRHSLKYIVQQYMETNCWMTYGSFFGEYVFKNNLLRITKYEYIYSDYNSSLYLYLGSVIQHAKLTQKN